MRPYLAVITDSFREALASRVLWLVVLGIGLFLAVLSPLGVRNEVTTQIKRFDVTSGQRLVSLLQAAAIMPRRTAAKAIVEAFPDDLQKRLRESERPDAQKVRTQDAIDALNALLDNDDWYDASLWAETTRLRELRELDEADESTLTDDTRRRRNRLRLEAALPGVFHPRSGDSVRLKYAIFDFPDAFVVTRATFNEILNRVALPLIVNLLLGVLGVFIAILVTGSIIPEVFQPGSLQLLLSKPISRSFLFLAKFVGGCSFVTLNITFMVVGLWLIVGFRLHHWNHNLLLCIPLFVFLFMVYYSVSAVTGLIWRNAIVSIALTVLFWIACFLVNVTNGMFDEFVAAPATLTQVARLNDDIVAATRNGDLQRFDRSKSEWQVLLEAEFGRGTRAIGPVALPESNQVLVVQTRGGPFNPFSGSNDRLMILTPDEDWKPIDGILLPAGTRDIFAGQDDTLYAYGTRGIARATSDKLEADGKPAPSGGVFSGLMSMLGKQVDGFEIINPDSVGLDTPMNVGLVPGSKSIVVYTRGRLIRLDPGDSNAYVVGTEVTLEGESNQRAALAATSNHVLIAREDSGIEIYDLQSLEKQSSVPVSDSGKPTDLIAQADGGTLVAMLFADRNVLLVDTTTGKLADVEVPHQGSIVSVAWPDGGPMLIAHDLNHVTLFDPSSEVVSDVLIPTPGVWRLVRDWFVKPLHFIFPKPGELGETVQGLVIGDSEIEAGPPSGVDLAYDRQLLAIWPPLISCGVFTLLMLAVGCYYVSRQDF
ncbi:MAG: ABC transporter permease [Pirellulaceae bacterium]